MQEWLSNPLALFCLALGSYWFGLQVYQLAGRTPLLHPLIVACVPSAIWLHSFAIPVVEFRQANQILHFMLGPATVALALPLYRQWSHIRENIVSLLMALLLGLALSLIVTLGLAYVMGASDKLLLTLAPKSVTTPITLEIIRITGGWPDLAAGIVIVTGVIGALVAPLMFKLVGVKNLAAQGFSMGLVAHGVGTARAYELNATMAAYASLGMGLSGIVSAVVLPWLMPWVLHWL